MLTTDRSLTKFILFGILTFGIYDIYVLSKISSDINTIASKYDRQHTMNFCPILFIFSWMTLGIAPLVWIIRLSSRIGNEQQRRQIPQTMSVDVFLLWNILGCVIGVGPFIYLYKLLHSMNELCKDYNQKESFTDRLHEMQQRHFADN